MNTQNERWESYSGQNVEVKILRRYLTVEDVCPECEGGLRIAVGKDTESGEQLYRIECLKCSWVTDALPDPEA